MPALSDAGPVTGHVDHVSCVQHTVAEQVVELEPSAVDRPVVTRLRVVEMIALGRQHGQVLHVAPCQLRTAQTNRFTIHTRDIPRRFPPPP